MCILEDVSWGEGSVECWIKLDLFVEGDLFVFWKFGSFNDD